MEKIETVTILDSKGRIVIPYRIRDVLDMKNGETAVRVIYEAGEIKITLA